ncbi:MAG: histidine kinase [Bacteroidales bacterium]|nr:histidine kinase [Bacteroidales bacterium]MCF8345216.1 histidine kinase [Bacteroidales bacterium]MCF8351847.1 histidine kinase [Bacteroidales bacterium]MCF8375266.1 histidine kinase [Bacteroidales bacterium]MCF8401260.1 histidine kinase [Bacteroidales bacterium]
MKPAKDILIGLNFKQVLWAQFAAITIWFLISIIQWANNPKGNLGILIPIIVRGVEGLSIWVASGVLVIILNVLLKRVRQLLAFMLVFLMIYPVAVLANLLSIGIRSLIGYSAPPLGNFFFVHSLHFFIPLLLILVFVSMLHFRHSLQTMRIKALQAESLSREANWLMLRYQVNPHFLFNALNSIRGLIGLDDEKARESITEMSDYFRYSLFVNDKSLVSIKEEIQAVRSYLNIQKMRYGERLEFEISEQDNISKFVIPVFAIQTLVENAVKYGLKSTDEKVAVELMLLKSGEDIMVEVINTGRLFPASNEEGTGTGLENLRKRLEIIDPGNELKLNQEDGKVKASMIMKIIPPGV